MINIENKSASRYILHIRKLIYKVKKKKRFSIQVIQDTSAREQ